MGNSSLFERRLRIFTGLILATFVVLHLTNHTLGLISLSTMEAMREVVTSFWRSILGSILLYGSLFLHFLLGLNSLYRRKSLKFSGWEKWQLFFGLCIVPLLAGHVAATFGTRIFVGVDLSYRSVLTAMFADSWPVIRQFLLLLVVWGHVVIGLHYFFRLFPQYRNLSLLLNSIFLFLPILVVASVALVANDLDLWQRQPPDNSSSYGAEYESGNGYGESNVSGLENRTLFHNVILYGYWGLLLLVLIVRYVREKAALSKGAFKVRLASGEELDGKAGQTILEVIRAAGFPHASVCGGRGRCTTCRVRVNSKEVANLPTPSPLEQEALDRIGAGENVRLACQTCPNGDVSVAPLVLPTANIEKMLEDVGTNCDERDVIAMFVDLRGSTDLAEQKLPFDILFILNMFMKEMSEAIELSNGHYSQFAGDGLMALYGIHSGFEEGCVAAIEGAIEMQKRLNKINRYLESELDEPLRMGIGINGGEAIVGVMGPPKAPNLTAIGDSINVAARLESHAALIGCQMVVSGKVLDNVIVDRLKFPLQRVQLKGKQQYVEVCEVENILEIEKPVSSRNRYEVTS